jgi:hypothetical protein
LVASVHLLDAIKLVGPEFAIGDGANPGLVVYGCVPAAPMPASRIGAA